MLLRLLTRPIVPALLAWGVALLFLFYGMQHFIMPWVAGRFKTTVAVPGLMGLKPEKAETALRARHLILMLDSISDFSSAIPAGAIQFQFPDSGTRVKPGRRIWVRISKGTRSVEMPSLRGMSQRQAEISLQQLGLRVGDIHLVQSAQVPAGAVIGSRPAPKTALQKGRIVDIEISSGTEPAITRMPSLTGLSLSQAKRQIETMHLDLGKVRYQPDKKNLPQTVLSQNPRPGAPLKGEPVDLVVSK